MYGNWNTGIFFMHDVLVFS